METKRASIYMICPGTVFRPDTADANHLPAYADGPIVDEGITLATSKVP